MNKIVILKIAGLIIVPFLVMLLGIFFLYPKINKDKHDQIVEEFERKQEEQFQSMASSLPAVNYDINEPPDTTTESELKGSYLEQQERIASSDPNVQKDSLYASLMAKADKNINQLEKNELRLHGLIDSLYSEIDRLDMKVDSLQNTDSKDENIDPEVFAQRIKSLLNLEDDELSPILRNLSNDQLVKLYFAGGTIQRQKILRALEAKKAAEIMMEIM